MKKIVLLMISAVLFASCKKEQETTSELTPTNEVVAATPDIHECYEAILKNDTISMVLISKQDQSVTGELQYNFFEKDKNIGTLAGQMIGDTLFADYTFKSEGKSSVREVVFLRNGKIFTEGYGDIVDDNSGKITFKDKKKLFFDSKIVLVKNDCE